MNKTERKPEWLINKEKRNSYYPEVEKMIRDFSLHTVCEEAGCPNRNECYSQRTATFLIMGPDCTRNCRFCKVSKGTPRELDPKEPLHVAQAAEKMKLKHVVVTSVTRDDLPDGGADHFAQCIREIRKHNPNCTIEVLVPDFQGSPEAIRTVVAEDPEVFNHNMETVLRLYSEVRPKANYHRSLQLLKQAKEWNPTLVTKSGIMVGLGETEPEVYQVLSDLHQNGCDAITIGQYLSPGPSYYPMFTYVLPQQFQVYEEMARQIGFRFVVSAPLVRSSYHAGLLISERGE